MEYCYVVGIAQNHGCLLTNERMFTDHKAAFAELMLDRIAGITYTRIFTLMVYSSSDVADRMQRRAGPFVKSLTELLVGPTLPEKCPAEVIFGSPCGDPHP